MAKLHLAISGKPKVDFANITMLWRVSHLNKAENKCAIPSVWKKSNECSGNEQCSFLFLPLLGSN